MKGQLAKIVLMCLFCVLVAGVVLGGAPDTAVVQALEAPLGDVVDLWHSPGEMLAGPAVGGGSSGG